MTELRPAMTEKELAHYSRAVAHRLLLRQRGGMDDPQTWIDVAASFGCRVLSYHEPGGSLGEYASAEDGQGVITYNDAATPPTQARVIVHETGHHLLMPLIPGYLFGEFVHCRYDDDPLDVRHRIAKRVEELCFRRR